MLLFFFFNYDSLFYACVCPFSKTKEQEDEEEEDDSQQLGPDNEKKIKEGFLTKKGLYF